MLRWAEPIRIALLAALLALACPAAPTTAAAGPSTAAAAPSVIIIAHRGASAERPEHTLAAYARAIAQGADFIEPDLVLTRDGVFIARHENELSLTTDVAGRPAFADRRRTLQIDGRTVAGWFSEDFTLAELRSLRARERWPDLRPASAAFDGQFMVPTLDEIIALVQAESARRGRVIGLYPELKHPGHFAAIGLPMEARLVEQLAAAGYTDASAPVIVQCFEVAPLQALARLTRLRLVQLVAGDGAPPDFVRTADPRRYRDLLSPRGLAAIAGYAHGIGVAKSLIRPVAADGTLGPATTLVADAHAAGLRVHAWTFRPENAFLPPALRQGDGLADPGDGEAELRSFLATGLDGLFTDAPAQAVAVRAALRATAPAGPSSPR